jgi:hypothetical protein
VTAGNGGFERLEGYVVAYRLAADNLRLGLDVIADSVNSIQTTRTAWKEVAESVGVAFVSVFASVDSCTEPTSPHPPGKGASRRSASRTAWQKARTRAGSLRPGAASTPLETSTA